MKDLLKQIFRFGIVGVISFGIDYGIFFLLHNFAGIHYLIANLCSFSVSVIVNYILNLKYVFTSNKSNKVQEVVWYIVLNVIGLGINELVLSLCVSYVAMSAMWAKIIATGVVMVYNFISRKILLEGGNKEDA